MIAQAYDEARHGSFQVSQRKLGDALDAPSAGRARARSFALLGEVGAVEVRV
jgi:hypothetical protein